MEIREQLFLEGVDRRTTGERGKQSSVLTMTNCRVFKRGETGFVSSIEGYSDLKTIQVPIIAVGSWRTKLVWLAKLASTQYRLIVTDNITGNDEYSFDYTAAEVTLPKLTITEEFIFVSNQDVLFYYDGVYWRKTTFSSTFPTLSLQSTASSTKAAGFISFIKGSDALRTPVSAVSAEYLILFSEQPTGLPIDFRQFTITIGATTLTTAFDGEWPTAEQLTNAFFGEISANTAITSVFTVTQPSEKTIKLVVIAAGSAGNGVAFYSNTLVNATFQQTVIGVDAVTAEAGPNKDNSVISLSTPVTGLVTINVTIPPSQTPTQVRDLFFTALNANATITTHFDLSKISIFDVPMIAITAKVGGTARNSSIFSVNNATNGIVSNVTALTGGAANPGAVAGTLLAGKQYWYTARYVYSDGHITKTAYPKLVTVSTDQSVYLTIATTRDIDSTVNTKVEIYRAYEGGKFFKIKTLQPEPEEFPFLTFIDRGEVELAELDEQNYIWTESHETQEIVRDRLVKANVEFPNVIFPSAVKSLINVSVGSGTISAGQTLLPKNSQVDVYAQLRYYNGTDTLYEKLTTLTTNDTDQILTVTFSTGIDPNVKEIALYANYRKNFTVAADAHKFKSVEIANKHIPFIYSSSSYSTNHPYNDLDEIKPLNPHLFLGWKYITVLQNTTPEVDEFDVRVYDGEWDIALEDFSNNNPEKTYWSIAYKSTSVTLSDFMYLKYTAPVYSYKTTGAVGGFAFETSPPSDTTYSFFSKYKKKYQKTDGANIWYIYELACVDAIKTAAKEGKMSVKISSYTGDRLSNDNQLNRYLNEWVPVLYILDTSETDSVPRSTYTNLLSDAIFGPLKNHVYLVLPTQTIYDDIVDKDINQNKPTGLNTNSQGVVADYTNATPPYPHKTPIHIKENRLIFEVGYLKETTVSTPSTYVVDNYTVHDLDYSVLATSDIKDTSIQGLVYLGAFSPTASGKVIENYGFTKRTSGSLTYSELNRANIYRTLVTQDLIRNIRTKFSNQLIWSDPIVIGTNISKARNFTFNNFKQISSDFGVIVDIKYKDNVLFVFCERGLCAISVGEILTSQSGQNVIVDSSRFLNSEMWVLRNLKSVSRQSIALGDSMLFFSDGFDVWMHSDTWKNITNGKIELGTIRGAYYDPKYKEYRIDSTTGTWFYSIEGDAWSGPHTITFQGGTSIGLNTYDFNTNKLRKQNDGWQIDGSTFETQLTVRMNTAEAPDVNKTWRKLVIDSNFATTVQYADNVNLIGAVSKVLASTQFQNGQYHVGISDAFSNIRNIVVKINGISQFILKNLVYYFDYRRRR